MSSPPPFLKIWLEVQLPPQKKGEGRGAHYVLCYGYGYNASEINLTKNLFLVSIRKHSCELKCQFVNYLTSMLTLMIGMHDIEKIERYRINPKVGNAKRKLYS